MLTIQVKEKIRSLVSHSYVTLTNRGNTSIDAVLDFVSKGLLIPVEGGWLTYVDFPTKRKIPFEYVACENAKIDITDLEKKLQSGKFDVFLYHQLGGYFAVQPMEQIYTLCQQYGCLVIVDVAGSIGTQYCDGKFADILVGSFGRWKLVDAGKGGFISCKNEELFDRLNVEEFTDEGQLQVINKKLDVVQKRITFLLEKRANIVRDLSQFDICHKKDPGFVVVIPFASEGEKEKIISYCSSNKLEYTLCPRYIRVQKNAVSIEIKRLEE